MPGPKSFHCASPEASQALAHALTALLLPGDVLLLSGDMGSGKSEFCRGLARGLGISGPIPSPSFTILNLYGEGRMPFKHFDWYRVSSAEELLASGLDEMIGGEGLTAIEWHERARELLPDDALEVRIISNDGGSRDISFHPRGGFRPLPYDCLTKGGE